MNRIVLIGRVTKDIELKTTPNGKSVTTFTLAVNRDYRNAEGNYDADFISCVAYGQQAETISKYVHKGDRFGVVGKLATRNYEKNGSKVYVTEVNVDGFEFLESKKDKPTVDVEPDYEDDDIPF